MKMYLRKNFIWFLIFSLILLAIPAYMPVVKAETGTLRLFPVEDTYVDSCHGFQIYGQKEQLYVARERQSTITGTRTCNKASLLKFDLTWIPEDVQLLSVYLNLYCENIGDTPASLNTFHCGSESWKEDELSYFTYFQNFLDCINPSTHNLIIIDEEEAWFKIDITEGTSSYIGGMLTEILQAESGLAQFSSKEGENIPFLEVVYQKRHSVITCFVSEETIQLGEVVTVYGKILPERANEEIKLEYQIGDTVFTQTAYTDMIGRYFDSFKIMEEGFWSVKAEWNGTDFYASAEGFNSFNATMGEIVEPIHFQVKFYAEKCCCSCLQYYRRVKDGLSELGVFDFELVSESEKVQDSLRQIYDRLKVPDNMRGNIVFSFNESYLFVNYVPVNIIIDFVSGSIEDYNSIVVKYDSLSKTYDVLNEYGVIKTCSSSDSVRSCIGTPGMPLSFFTAFPLIMISGLLDGVNPCAFAVLFFFIAFLYASREKTIKKTKKRVFFTGSIYIAAVYLGYLVIGLAIMGAINVTPFPYFIAKITAAFVIILGLINIKDYFWPNKGLSLKIPISQWRTIAKWMHKNTLPSTFIVGLLVSIVEFPCTGGIYLAILGMLASQTTFLQGFIYLLMYNLAFILPLIIILIVSSNQVFLEKMRRWQASKGNRMKLFTGVIMIITGLYLLLTEWI